MSAAGADNATRRDAHVTGKRTITVGKLMHPQRLPRYERFAPIPAHLGNSVPTSNVAFGSSFSSHTAGAGRSDWTAKHSSTCGNDRHSRGHLSATAPQTGAACSPKVTPREAAAAARYREEREADLREAEDFAVRLRHLQRQQIRQGRKVKEESDRRMMQQQLQILWQQQQLSRRAESDTSTKSGATLSECATGEAPSTGPPQPPGRSMTSSRPTTALQTDIMEDELESETMNNTNSDGAVSSSNRGHHKLCPNHISTLEHSVPQNTNAALPPSPTLGTKVPRSLSAGNLQQLPSVSPQQTRGNLDATEVPQLEKDFSLLQCLFNEQLLTSNSVVAELKRLGEASVVQRVREIAAAKFLTAVDKNDVHYLVGAVLGTERVPERETDHLFRFLDWRCAGRIDLRELPNNFSLLFHPTQTLLVVQFKRMLASRGLSTAMLSVMEVQLVFASMEIVFGGHGEDLRSVIDELAEELWAYANASKQVPLNIVRSVLGRQRGLMNLLASFSPWSPVKMRSLPSPDPDVEIQMLYQRFIELRKRGASQHELNSTFQALVGDSTIAAAIAASGQAVMPSSSMVRSSIPLNSITMAPAANDTVKSGERNARVRPDAGEKLGGWGPNVSLGSVTEAADLPQGCTPASAPFVGASTVVRRPPSPWYFGTYSTAVQRHMKLQQLKQHSSPSGTPVVDQLSPKAPRHSRPSESQAPEKPADRTTDSKHRTKKAVSAKKLAKISRSGSPSTCTEVGQIGPAASEDVGLVHEEVDRATPLLVTRDSLLPSGGVASEVTKAKKKIRRCSSVADSSEAGEVASALMWSVSSLPAEDPASLRMVADRYMRSRLAAGEDIHDVKEALEWVYTRAWGEH